MRASILLKVAGLTFALFAVSAVRGQDKDAPPAPEPKAVTLPLTRVVLFNAGVGYFHREGKVDGDARLDLRFPEADVNDLIKSLVISDKDGGKARAVTYDAVPDAPAFDVDHAFASLGYGQVKTSIRSMPPLYWIRPKVNGP